MQLQWFQYKSLYGVQKRDNSVAGCIPYMEELKGGMQDAHKVHFPQRRNLKDWQQIILLLILQPILQDKMQVWAIINIKDCFTIPRHNSDHFSKPTNKSLVAISGHKTKGILKVRSRRPAHDNSLIEQINEWKGTSPHSRQLHTFRNESSFEYSFSGKCQMGLSFGPPWGNPWSIR